MKRNEEMELSYRYFIKDAPLVENPNIDKSKHVVEQLVDCRCDRRFRVYVNGSNPISDTVMKDVNCPHCGARAEDALMISGHSAGVFNASIVKRG